MKHFQVCLDILEEEEASLGVRESILTPATSTAEQAQTNFVSGAGTANYDHPLMLSPMDRYLYGVDELLSLGEDALSIVLNNVAVVHFRAGNVTTSLEVMTECVKLNPILSTPYHNMATILEVSKQEKPSATYRLHASEIDAKRNNFSDPSDSSSFSSSSALMSSVMVKIGETEVQSAKTKLANNNEEDFVSKSSDTWTSMFIDTVSFLVSSRTRRKGDYGRTEDLLLGDLKRPSANSFTLGKHILFPPLLNIIQI